PPPSMSMVVKPHQAFFLAARTDRAAGLVPIPVRVPAPRLHPHAPRLAVGPCRERFPVGRRASRSGRQARTTVYPCGTGHGPMHLMPSTPRASGTPSARAHPSNERCLRRITRRHNGGSRQPRLLHLRGSSSVLMSPGQTLVLEDARPRLTPVWRPPRPSPGAPPAHPPPNPNPSPPPPPPPPPRPHTPPTL